VANPPSDTSRSQIRAPLQEVRDRSAAADSLPPAELFRAALSGTAPFVTARSGPYHYTLGPAAAAGAGAERLRALLERPDRWLHHPEARLVKEARSAAVVRLPPPLEDLLLKCYPLRSRWDLFKNLPRSSRARRAFAAAHALPRLGIATPPAPGFVDVVIGMVKVRSFLVTRFLDGYRDLRSALLHEPALVDPAARRSVLYAAADLLARLHCGGVIHPDLKPVNILVRLEPEPAVPACELQVSLALIDLDRVRLARSVPRRLRLRNLVQLHGSIQDRVSYRERLRFLRRYASRAGLAMADIDLRQVERETLAWMGKREDWPAG